MRCNLLCLFFQDIIDRIIACSDRSVLYTIIPLLIYMFLFLVDASSAVDFSILRRNKEEGCATMMSYQCVLLLFIGLGTSAVEVQRPRGVPISSTHMQFNLELPTLYYSSY